MQNIEHFINIVNANYLSTEREHAEFFQNNLCFGKKETIIEDDIKEE
jgi:hypothetical protein